MDWVNEGQLRAGKMPNGVFNVEVVRLLWEKRDGSSFRTSKGDQQFGIILADTKGREVMDMISINDAAGWKLARLLSAAGADMQMMKDKNIGMAHFKDREFAAKALIGRKLTIGVGYNLDSGYPEVTPMKPGTPEVEGDPAPTSTNASRAANAARPYAAAPTGSAPADAGVDDDDIPF
jgi:hypothetical protein